MLMWKGVFPEGLPSRWSCTKGWLRETLRGNTWGAYLWQRVFWEPRIENKKRNI